MCAVSARAKLNLSLRVLAREQSGFHQIETLFCALELADELTVELGGSAIELEVGAPADAPGTVGDPGPLETNHAMRAAHAFFRALGKPGAARIRLVKRIPVGAGLGGGSSDAAAVLLALNRLHGEPFNADRLVALGGSLGSDVPFFLTGAVLALAWGRGDRLLPLPPLPSASVVLAVPPERIATADAYARLASRRGAHAMTGPEIVTLPRSWTEVAGVAANDFEASAFEDFPRLGDLRSLLEGCGASVARMTGSGSVVFGVFDELAAAADAIAALQRGHPDVQPVLTRTAESFPRT
jgi:4-diphosphocytidyl-2-C-methyl-D-erythritol kinase